MPKSTAHNVDESLPTHEHETHSSRDADAVEPSYGREAPAEQTVEAPLPALEGGTEEGLLNDEDTTPHTNAVPPMHVPNRPPRRAKLYHHCPRERVEPDKGWVSLNRLIDVEG